MKIKKKNATIPINGKIVDTDNVEDKTNNAPSIRLVEEMLETIEVDNFIIAKEGYTILEKYIFKQGQHYFGNIIIKKDEGYFGIDGQTIVATFEKSIKGVINSGCFLTQDKWNTSAIGYLYINTNQIIVADKNNTDKYNIAKISIDVVVE